MVGRAEYGTEVAETNLKTVMRTENGKSGGIVIRI